MNYRKLGKTDFEISEISLGTWQVGGKWGSSFDHKNAENIINCAIDNGVNFIDTADVYSDGLSEEAVGKAVRSRSGRIFVATKCGRKIFPHSNAGYKTETLQKFVEDSKQSVGSSSEFGQPGRMMDDMIEHIAMKNPSLFTINI